MRFYHVVDFDHLNSAPEDGYCNIIANGLQIVYEIFCVCWKVRSRNSLGFSSNVLIFLLSGEATVYLLETRP